MPSSALGPAVYAHLHGATPGAPLLLYLGGAIDEATYERRRESTPDELAAAMPRAESGEPCMGLLVVSSPPAVRTPEGTRHEAFALALAALLAEARLGAAAIAGVVGNSLGAHLAVGLAATLPRASRLVTIAGVGMVGALAGERLGAIEEVCCFSNYDDPVRGYSERFFAWLAERRIPARLISRPGGHDLADYLAAESVREALAFAVGS